MFYEGGDGSTEGCDTYSERGACLSGLAQDGEGGGGVHGLEDADRARVLEGERVGRRGEELVHDPQVADVVHRRGDDERELRELPVGVGVTAVGAVPHPRLTR